MCPKQLSDGLINGGSQWLRVGRRTLEDWGEGGWGGSLGRFDYAPASYVW